MENVVRLVDRGTFTYLVRLAPDWLMVDAGWPGSLPVVQRQLRAYRIGLGEIKWVLITHTHPDHAGLAQTLKQAAGARLLLHACQIAHLPELAAFLARKGGYDPIRVEPGDVVLSGDTRPQLARLGMAGEVVATPGHSADSVSLALDSGLAFTGDLPMPAFAPEAAAAQVRASWEALLARGARQFHPSHAEPFAAEAVHAALGG